MSKLTRLNQLAQKHTGFSDLYELAGAYRHGYVPTLRITNRNSERLANAYDAIQRRLCSGRKAERHYPQPR